VVEFQHKLAKNVEAEIMATTPYSTLTEAASVGDFLLAHSKSHPNNNLQRRNRK